MIDRSTCAGRRHQGRTRPTQRARWLSHRASWLAGYWLRVCLQGPWEPTTSPTALTIENLQRLPKRREAIVADALAADPDTANETVKLIVFAWPYLGLTDRARLLTLALTPEVRAAAAAQANERAWQ
jgi:hypothetical protein